MSSVTQISSYNLNGIRASINKGLVDWLKIQNPDIICFQEVKANLNQIDINIFTDLGYKYVYWHSAQKKGYSGVAVLSKIEAISYQEGIGIEKYDNEGRFIQLEFEGYTLINAYFPSGTSGDIRQQFKYDWLDDFASYISDLKKNVENIIICGDVNICHKEIDIHNPVSNKKSSGFLVEERNWISQLLNLGFIDVFRYFDSSVGRYTWWSYRFNARKRNLGWRIDYFFTSTSMVSRLKNCCILEKIDFSDHSPVVLELCK